MTRKTNADGAWNSNQTSAQFNDVFDADMQSTEPEILDADMQVTPEAFDSARTICTQLLPAAYDGERVAVGDAAYHHSGEPQNAALSQVRL